MFSFKVLSWITLIGILCVTALVTLQVMEFLHFRAIPSVWPLLPKP